MYVCVYGTIAIVRARTFFVLSRAPILLFIMMILHGLRTDKAKRTLEPRVLACLKNKPQSHTDSNHGYSYCSNVLPFMLRSDKACVSNETDRGRE